MIRIDDEKLVGTKEEAIAYFENVLTFLKAERYVEKVNNILAELENCKKYEVIIYFNAMDEDFHILD